MREQKLRRKTFVIADAVEHGYSTSSNVVSLCAAFETGPTMIPELPYIIHQMRPGLVECIYDVVWQGYPTTAISIFVD